MKKYITFLLLALVIVFGACNTKEKQIAQATLATTADNQPIGTARFYALNDGKIKMDLVIDFPMRADSNVAVH